MEVTPLKAVILAGGFGTRLRPLSCTRPKTLFPLINKPLLEWIFERLAKNGVTEAILAVNKLTEFYIKQQRIARSSLKVKYSHDPPKTPLGTAGPLKRAERLIGLGAPFLVLNGDIFADLSYRELFEQHKKKGAMATLALCTVEDPSRYGVAELTENERITRFIEKPPKGESPSNLINAGVYVLNPEVLQLIPEGKAVSMEREIFPILAEERSLYGHLIEGMWMDIGKPEEYLQANRRILDSVSTEQKTRKKNRYELKRPVALDKGVIIGAGSTIGPYAVLGRNVKVGKNANIKNSVVFPDAVIEDYALVKGAIIGEGAVIGRQTKIGEGCIVADQARIKEGVCLENKTSVCPAREISEKTLKSKIAS
jgi:mannose-1-phosphate guanylyltransferase